ncbi:MAG: TatD family hydrolase [Vulcanimicrobiaceae bacterium]
MIDTHAHLHDPSFDDDLDEVLRRAREAGVETIVTVGCDLDDSERAMLLAERANLAWTLGIHPHEAKDAPANITEAFDALLARSPVQPRAIGEIGLDFHYDHSPRDIQVQIMEKQLAYARVRDMPLVFHQREAFPTFVETLRKNRFDGMRGIVHCFSGTPDEARRLTNEFGFLLGIGGVVTFKNADRLREAVRIVGIEHLVLETDCPYLAPQPHRGERNEPSYMTYTIDRLCELLVCDRIELLGITSRNARELLAL